MPGTPTTVENAGTSLSTTAPAPIFAWLPTVTGPSTFAPAEIGDMIAYRRVAFAGVLARSAERRALKDGHVVANDAVSPITTPTP
jgi:hypothetical protein